MHHFDGCTNSVPLPSSADLLTARTVLSQTVTTSGRNDGK